MATRTQMQVESAPTYDGDGAAWADHQAAMLRAGRFDQLDAENLADEIESLAKREFHVLTSALTIVLVHLVKWDFQPWQRSRSWYFSVLEHRTRVARQFRDNPSFKSRLDEALDQAWPTVVPQVLLETHMDRREFPSACPYDWDEIMDRPVEWPQP